MSRQLLKRIRQHRPKSAADAVPIRSDAFAEQFLDGLADASCYVWQLIGIWIRTPAIMPYRANSVTRTIIEASALRKVPSRGSSNSRREALSYCSPRVRADHSRVGAHEFVGPIKPPFTYRRSKHALNNEVPAKRGIPPEFRRLERSSRRLRASLVNRDGGPLPTTAPMIMFRSSRIGRYSRL